MPCIEFAVKALVLRDGRFLAVHKQNCRCSKFELPGGRMEYGETAEQTIIREMREETGLAVCPKKLIDTWHYMGIGYQVTGIVYLCTAEPDKQIRLSSEHDRYAWLTPEQIPNISKTFREKMLRWDWEELFAREQAQARKSKRVP